MNKKLKQRIERLEAAVFGSITKTEPNVSQALELLHTQELSASHGVTLLIQELLDKLHKAELDVAYMTQALNKALSQLGELQHEHSKTFQRYSQM